MAGLILDTMFSAALQDQIVHERLLRPIKEEKRYPNEERARLCMESILLWGPALVFKLPNELVVDMKELQRLGICEIADPRPNSFPFRNGDNPSKEEVAAAIDEIKYLKPFIMPFLYRAMKKAFGPDTIHEKAFGISFSELGYRKFRRMVEALPELAVYNAVGDWESVNESDFPEEAVTLIDVNILDETLIPTILMLTNQPKKLITESHIRSLPVLSEIIRPSVKAGLHPPPSVSNALSIVKVALSDAGLELPSIRSVSHLRDLMGDDRVVSFRNVVWEFTNALKEGNVDAIPNMKKRVVDANRAVKEIARQRRRLRWTFLAPLAVGMAETLIGLLPSVSVAMTLGLTATDFALKRKENRNKWLWLFPHRRSSG